MPDWSRLGDRRMTAATPFVAMIATLGGGFTGFVSRLGLGTFLVLGETLPDFGN